VAFHVEISRGFRRARAFNLDEAKLRGTIVEPWMRGRVIQLGGRDWEPRDSRLRILEGPELADSDLAMGRGWSNAERVSENVTRRLIEAAAVPVAHAVAVRAETPEGEAELIRMLKRLGLHVAPWSELRGRILRADRTDPAGIGYAAVLAVESGDPPPSWLFDAGLARGALGRRAVIAQLGGGAIPADLAGVEVMRLEPGEEASVRALGERLGP
jgi:hypothetical protein